MPKVPPTLSTFPTFINRKLYALESEPKPADLNAIRELLDVVQEERVLSDEEVQEWKRTEKKVLENQNAFRKTTGKDDRVLFLLVILLIKIGLQVLQFFYQAEFSEINLLMLSFWPMDFLLVVIYLLLFYDSRGFLWIPVESHSLEIEDYEDWKERVRFCPVQPQVSENEDDDDWEESMTSTELQSKQKALLNRWTSLAKERVEYLSSNIWCCFARIVNMIYFFFWVFVLFGHMLEKPSFKSSTTPEIFFLLVQYFFSSFIASFFFLQFIDEYGSKTSNKNSD